MRVLSIDIGRMNYAYCAADFSEDQRKVQVVDLQTVNLGSERCLTGTQYVDRLVAYWKSCTLLGTFHPDVVLIEQQLGAATTNLSVAIATYTFFTSVMGIPCRMVQPSAKMEGWRRFHDIFGDLCQKDPGDAGPKTTYYARKKASVRLANTLRTHIGLEELRGGKVDDLADAFLQCFCHLPHQHARKRKRNSTVEKPEEGEILDDEPSP